MLLLQPAKQHVPTTHLPKLERDAFVSATCTLIASGISYARGCGQNVVLGMLGRIMENQDKF